MRTSSFGPALILWRLLQRLQKVHISWPSTIVDAGSNYHEDNKVPCHYHPSEWALLLLRKCGLDGAGGACHSNHTSTQSLLGSHSQMTILQLHSYLFPPWGLGKARSVYQDLVWASSVLASRSAPKKKTNSWCVVDISGDQLGVYSECTLWDI